MPHHEVVDLLRHEGLLDRSAGALHVGPETHELRGRQLFDVGDVVTEDYKAVAGVRLVASKANEAGLCLAD
ncbi:hypothetical protein P9139_06375 [Curtobacterium flaccumfaciens]|nr:hypothetical protein P9139_06375 [Curtobacterium flaccumfaciens]